MSKRILNTLSKEVSGQHSAAKIVCRMKFICPQKWGKLRKTDIPSIRHCPVCAKNVHYCINQKELEDAIQAKHCIAFEAEQLGIGKSVMLGIPIGLKPSRPSLGKQTIWGKLSALLRWTK